MFTSSLFRFESDYEQLKHSSTPDYPLKSVCIFDISLLTSLKFKEHSKLIGTKYSISYRSMMEIDIYN